MNRLNPKQPRRARWLLLLLLAAPVGGCIEESPTPAVFDVLLESTKFDNRLRAPVAIFRDDVAIDTLPAGTTRVYPLNRKGAIRHGWRLIAPFGVDGRKAGEEPYANLGVQFRVNHEYRITNENVGGTGETIFTPRISNSLFSTALRLGVNINREDQMLTSYIIQPNSFTNLDSAPYFYWNSNSNVVLYVVNGSGTYFYERDDTTSYRLRLNNGFSTPGNLEGAGVTEIIYVP